MKWEDIAKHIPGRSALACRLRYQNYSEKRPVWDEEKRNKLARLYDRFKEQMWNIIAKEMNMPWRAIESMHWQLGEENMAQRANVPVFKPSSTGTRSPPSSFTRSPPMLAAAPSIDLPSQSSTVPLQGRRRRSTSDGRRRDSAKAALSTQLLPLSEAPRVRAPIETETALIGTAGPFLPSGPSAEQHPEGSPSPEPSTTSGSADVKIEERRHSE